MKSLNSSFHPPSIPDVTEDNYLMPNNPEVVIWTDKEVSRYMHSWKKVGNKTVKTDPCGNLLALSKSEK